MEPKIFGYARVSSKGQNLDRQIFLLKEEGIDERDIFVEKESAKDFERPVFRQLVDLIMREGDILIVTELERFGRNYTEIHKEWNAITKTKKMDIKVLDMPLLDTTMAKDLLGNLITDLILNLLAYVAHRERVEKKVLQTQGIERAHARGVKFGRPGVKYPDNWKEVYEQWTSGTITAREAMKLTSLKKDSFYKLVGEYEYSLKKSSISLPSGSLLDKQVKGG